MDDSTQAPAQGIFRNWLTKPFSESMDAFSWVLFLGFAIIVSFFWTRVLKHISDAV